jgi:uncharacterized protein
VREATISRPTGEVVCTCEIAERYHERLVGLLGRRSLPAGEGLLIRPASSVHTLFMRFPIDVVFLDRDGVVVGIRHNVAPWRAAFARRAHSTLELAAGEAGRAGVEVGDRLAGAW